MHNTYTKKIRLFLLSILLVPMLFSATPILLAHAAENPVVVEHSEVVNSVLLAANASPAPAATKSGESDALTNTLQSAMTIVIVLMKMLYALLIPIIALTGKFMSNDWVVGNVFNVDIVIEVIWIFIRNMVNIGAVFLLLYLAFTNIVPVKWKQPWEVKVMLPKIAIALIVANFSLLACRTIITFSAVVTTAAFSIPNEAGKAIELGGGTDKNSLNSLISGVTLWAEPLGKRSNLVGQAKATSCTPAPQLSDTPTASEIEQHTIAQQAYDTCSNKVNSSSDIQGKEATLGANGGEDTYVVECLHTSYGVNFSGDVSSSAQESFLVGNPAYDGSKFVPGDNGNRRLSFVAKMGTAAWETAYKEKVGNVTDTLNKGSLAQYPYYLDCIQNLQQLAFSARNAMFVYAFNLMKIPQYESALSNYKSFGDILVKQGVALIFFFGFMIITIGLMVAMIFRGFMIWVLMATAPIWMAAMVLGMEGKISSKLGGLVAFFKISLMPAVVGLILSIGFLMINFLKFIGGLDGGKAGRLALGPVNIFFSTNDPIVGGLSNIFDLMFAIITLCVLYLSVFEAIAWGFKDGGVMGKWIDTHVTGKVAQFGKDIGKNVKDEAMSFPIIPIPGKGAVGISALADAQKIKMNEWQTGINRKKEVQLGEVLDMDTYQKFKISAEGKAAAARNFSSSNLKSKDAFFSALKDLGDSSEARKVRLGVANGNYKKVQIGDATYDVPGNVQRELETHFTKYKHDNPGYKTPVDNANLYLKNKGELTYIPADVWTAVDAPFAPKVTASGTASLAAKGNDLEFKDAAGNAKPIKLGDINGGSFTGISPAPTSVDDLAGKFNQANITSKELYKAFCGFCAALKKQGVKSDEIKTYLGGKGINTDTSKFSANATTGALNYSGKALIPVNTSKTMASVIADLMV